MPGGSTARPFIEARLELAAHNSSILYLKLVSLAIAVRPPDDVPHQQRLAGNKAGMQAAAKSAVQ